MDLSAPPAQDGAARLLGALLDLRRMAGASVEPLRVARLDQDGAPRLPEGFEPAFERACAALGVQGLVLADVAPEALDSYEQIAELRLDLSASAAALVAVPDAELTRAAEAAAAAAPQARFAAGTARAADGAQLSTFAHGTGEPVVLIQALGMPVELAGGLLETLGDRVRLHTWEVRGALDFADDFDALDVGIETEVSDLCCVLDHFGLQRAHLLAFCIGAPLALRAAVAHPERFASVTLVNGGFGLADARTEYEQQFHSVFPKVGQSRPAAQLFHKLFRGAGGKAAGGTGLAVRDPHAHLMYLPYVHPEALYRYGRTVTPLLQSDVLAWVGDLRVPSLFVATDRDPVSDPRAAQLVAERVEGAERVELSGDRHLALMDDPEALARVWLPFVERHPA